MEGNTHTVAVFHAACSEILRVFCTEGIYGTVICLYSDGVGSTSNDRAGYCKGNMFVINGIRIFTCHSNNTDFFQGCCFQISDISNINMRSRGNSSLEVSGNC